MCPPLKIFSRTRIIRAIFSKRPPILQRAFLLVILSMALLLLDSRAYLENNLRYWLQGIVFPLQSVANLPSKLFYKTLAAFTTQENLLKENQAIKTQLILLKLHQQRFLDLENENRQLRALLHSSEELHVSVKVAEVLFVAASAHSGEWVLNKGSEEGVYVGQAVLDEQGLLGQIIIVGPKTSRVMLLSDSRSSVPVESLATGLRSILQGDGVGHPLSLAFIPKTETMMIGDVLVSSGAGDRFPKGYPVGKISEIVNHPGDQFLSISVMPIAQLDRKRFVLLVEETND